MKTTVKTELINLYNHIGDDFILKLTSNHRIVLRTIIDNTIGSGHLSYIPVNSLNRNYLYDLISWGMVDICKKEDVEQEVSQQIIDRNGKIFTFSRQSDNQEKIYPTTYGIAVYHYLNLNSKKNTSGHNRIIYDFIKDRRLKNMLVADDIQFKTKYGFSRPDVFAITKTLNEKEIKPTAYEVKHSRSDFLSDMKKEEKWRSYLEVAEKLYYVCPKGLIRKEELPKECGLIYQQENGSFYVEKNAKKGNGKIDVPTLMKLLLRLESEDKVILIKPGFEKPEGDLHE